MRIASVLLTASLAFAITGCNGGGGAPSTAKGAEKPARVEVPKPATVTAAQWGSKPQDMGGEVAQTPTYLTVHHAGEVWKPGSDPVKKLTGLQTWGAREKGWPDLPYHFLVAPDGTIYEGRSVAYAPETNTKYDTTGHIGINLWGNFEEQRVSEAQLRSLVNLLAYFSQQYNVDPATIAGHTDRAETLCPGRDLYRYVHDGLITQWVKETQAGKAPQIALLPPLPEGPAAVIVQ